MEREAHVRAAIVDGVDVVAVGEQTERLPPDVHDEPAGRAELAERGGADEVLGENGGHRFLLYRSWRIASERRTSSNV
jgi:hypothetical protein